MACRSGVKPLSGALTLGLALYFSVVWLFRDNFSCRPRSEESPARGSSWDLHREATVPWPCRRDPDQTQISAPFFRSYPHEVVHSTAVWPPRPGAALPSAFSRQHQSSISTAANHAFRFILGTPLAVWFPDGIDKNSWATHWGGGQRNESFSSERKPTED